jgi:glycosyltransferase involved in cell wall biosynthesis
MKNKINNIQPLVTVVIPVYNGAKFLKEAVSSVMASSYKNFEVILIDDGSKDESKELCKRLEKQYKRVHFYGFKQNKGLGRVLNFALKQAKGEYICRINQDDEMHPSRIEKQVAFMKNNPDVILVGSWLMVEDENGNRRINKFLEHDEEIKKTWLKLSPCWDASVMYRRESALAVGGYDQKFWPADDLHMWYRLGKLGKIANIQEPLVKIKFHTAAASVKHHRKHMITTYKVHQWANKHIQKADWGTQIYWLCQLAAGFIMPAHLNWFIYRLLKKYFIYRSADAKKETSKMKNFLVHSKYASLPL